MRSAPREPEAPSMKKSFFRSVVSAMAGFHLHARRPRAYLHRRVRPSSTSLAEPGRDLVRGNAKDRLLAPLRQYRLWTALGLLVAIVAAGTRFAAIGLVPPSIKLKPFAHATGSTALVIGKSRSFRQSTPDNYSRSLSPRAFALADIVASPELAKYVARAAGLPVSSIGIMGPVWTELQRTQAWANGPKRASQIITEKDPYHITLDVETELPPWPPVIDVVTQAPNAETAARLATAVATGLNAYVLHMQTTTGVLPADRYEVSQIAPVAVAPARTSQLVSVGAFTLVAVFVLWCGLLIAVSSLIRDFRASAASPKADGPFDRSSVSGQLLRREPIDAPTTMDA